MPSVVNDRERQINWLCFKLSYPPPPPRADTFDMYRQLISGGYKEMSSILADQERSRIWAQMWELRGLGQWVQLYTGAQIYLGDLTPYLTYG